MAVHYPLGIWKTIAIAFLLMLGLGLTPTRMANRIMYLVYHTPGLLFASFRVPPPAPHTLKAAILNVTADFNELTFLVQDFLRSQGIDPNIETQFRYYLAQRAVRSHPVLEVALDWVLAVYKFAFPFVIISLLAKATGSTNTNDSGAIDNKREHRHQNTISSTIAVANNNNANTGSSSSGDISTLNEKTSTRNAHSFDPKKINTTKIQRNSLALENTLPANNNSNSLNRTWAEEQLAGPHHLANRKSNRHVNTPGARLRMEQKNTIDGTMNANTTNKNNNNKRPLQDAPQQEASIPAVGVDLRHIGKYNNNNNVPYNIMGLPYLDPPTAVNGKRHETLADREKRYARENPRRFPPPPPGMPQLKALTVEDVLQEEAAAAEKRTAAA